MPKRGRSTTGRPQKTALELADRIETKLRELKLHSGAEEWDPVVGMAVIGAEAFKKGDDMMALAAYKEVASYVRPKLKPKEVDDTEPDALAIDARARTLEILLRAKMPIPEHLQDPDILSRIRDPDLLPYIEDAEVIPGTEAD